MNAVTKWISKEYSRSPIAFWVWLLLCVGAIAGYAYLKSGGH